MIKAILSDGGNILFSDNEDRAHFVNYVHKETEVGKAQIEKDLSEMKTRLRQHAGTTKHSAYEDLLQKYQLTDFFGNITGEKKLYPGIRETLESLDGLVDFIVVTDARKPGKVLFDALRKMGVQKGVKNIVSSVDVGFTKPATEFFDAVMKENGYKAEETAFVGHDYDEVVGAYRYGIPHVIVFNYNEKEIGKIRQQIPPENLHVIENRPNRDNFSEVREILRKINAKSQG